jgi:hypothetical protein
MMSADAEYAGSFRAVLDEAVRLRLRADVPVGCYLSGGLDSCSVLGLAARHHPEPIRALTLTFDRADYDESEFARARRRWENGGLETYGPSVLRMKNNSRLRSTRQTAGAALTRRAETVLRRRPLSRAQLKALINEATVDAHDENERLMGLPLPKVVPVGAE